MKITISIECDSEKHAQEILTRLNMTGTYTPPASYIPASFSAQHTAVECKYLDKLPFDPMVDDKPLTFGKYKGHTPRQLLDADPQYLLWADDNLDYSPCSKQLIKLLKHLHRGEELEKPEDFSAPVNDDIPF